ncbi:MAG: nucleotidyl transferase AbiEii/AbiGii toxin family protein, partial [Acidimicrobiia bacterium]
MAGPTLAADELAGRKVVALFGRAEARDFADVHALLERYTKDELLSLAREIDDGFDDQVFAEMLESIARYPDVVIADVGA